MITSNDQAIVPKINQSRLWHHTHTHIWNLLTRFRRNFRVIKKISDPTAQYWYQQYRKYNPILFWGCARTVQYWRMLTGEKSFSFWNFLQSQRLLRLILVNTDFLIFSTADQHLSFFSLGLSAHRLFLPEKGFYTTNNNKQQSYYFDKRWSSYYLRYLLPSSLWLLILLPLLPNWVVEVVLNVVNYKVLRNLVTVHVVKRMPFGDRPVISNRRFPKMNSVPNVDRMVPVWVVHPDVAVYRTVPVPTVPRHTFVIPKIYSHSHL